MAVHKIKAKDDSAPKPEKDPKNRPADTNVYNVHKGPKTDKKSKRALKKEQKKAKKAKKEKQPKKPHSKPVRILLFPFKPFFALGRYFRNSWREIRLVQWPTRRFTWKLTLSVVIFVGLFGALITVLDMLFTILFSNIIK